MTLLKSVWYGPCRRCDIAGPTQLTSVEETWYFS